MLSEFILKFISIVTIVDIAVWGINSGKRLPDYTLKVSNKYCGFRFIYLGSVGFFGLMANQPPWVI